MAKKRVVTPEDSPLIGQLKSAIRDSGISLNELSKRCGVDHSQLSRFIRGERAISLAAAEKVMVYFGLSVTPTKPVEK
jgi:transcriptional regulator with XRE-family HTH domain